MEKATVIALLEKYWQAETTIAEEQALAAYFRGEDVAVELLPYSELFAYFQEEAQVSAGADFGDRILQQLGLPLDGEMAPTRGGAAPVEMVPARGHESAVEMVPVVPITRAPFRLGVAAAAAAIILIVAGMFLLKPAGQPTILADSRSAGQRGPGTEIGRYDSADQSTRESTGRPADQGRSGERTGVADTYDDPEKALAAVRHALLIVSKNLNQGRRELAGAHK